jgi:hypothetical protein
MSRTQKTKDTTSPVKRYIEWSSDEKCWKSYDKEKKENVLLPINTPFILLDQLTTVAGYDDKAEKSFYGTEVRDIKKPIKVFCGKEKVAEGAWADIKDTLRGLKFAKSVYAMAKINDEFQLVQFKLSGCALSWFDFVESEGVNNLEGDIVIAVVDTKYGKKGKVEFEAPVFKVVKRELSVDAAEQANGMDIALQAYLEAYLEETPKDETPDGDADRESAMNDDEPPTTDYGGVAHDDATASDPADEVLDEEPPF